MKKRALVILMNMCFWFASAFAMVAGPASITGVVKSFDEKSVTIEGEKSIFEIPKSFISDRDLKTNKKVEVLFSLEQLSQIKTTIKKPR